MTAQAFAEAIETAVSSHYDREAIRRHAERFNRTRFADEMEVLIAQEVAGKPQ